MPVRLFVGENCLSLHRRELERLGKRCLIITGGGSAVRCGAFGDVVSILEATGIAYTVFDRVRSNPTVGSCREAGKLAAESGAEFLIGIGGGSAMDTAKAASVFAADPDLDEAGFYAKKWVRHPLPVALIGTTAGTGSEVTNVSVLVDSRGVKHSIHDDLLYAAVSFGDPGYTMSLPRAITLSTGIDVLAHCSESYFSKKAGSISRAFAVKGVSLLYAPLLAAAKGELLSAEQRGQLYEASILGGLAISVTGTCFPHNVGYYLTEQLGLPHGFACAAFFPELLSHVKSCDPGLADAFFRETGCSEKELQELVAAVMDGQQITVDPMSVESALPRWEKNGSVMNTVGTVTCDDIRRFFGKFF